MVVDVKRDLAALTTIPETTLTKLTDKLEWCICNAIDEASKSGESTVELDFGFATLLINIENEQIRYKFKPEMRFEQSLVKTLVQGDNPLTHVFEAALVNKMTRVVKDFF